MLTHPLYEQINQNTDSNYPKKLLSELIDDICDRHPTKVAVVSGDRTQTYALLHRRSNEVANYLKNQGIGRGDLVGLCCNRDVDMPALMIGIIKAGAGYVPLDPDYPTDRLQYMVEDSEVRHIIAHSDQQSLTEAFNLPTTVVDRDWDTIAKAGSTLVQDPSSPKTDVAYVIYTSGSTGTPKGVLVPHGAVVNFLWSLIEWPGFTENDRILASTTLSFDISVLEVFLPLVTGGSLAVIDRRTAKDTAALVAAVHQHDVNCIQATPAMWRMIVEADFVRRPGMKFISGGEPLPRDLIRPMLDRCDELWNLYGPTETTVWSTGVKIESDEGRILIGKPFANTQVYIVDEDNNLCPPETPGELLIAGDGMTLGYLNRPELTSEKFCDWNGIQVYRTGDLARLTEDGQVDHMGRIDSQIKFNGHRIELGEIDAAMASQPGVRQAATVMREDRPGDKRLVGYLLALDEATPDVNHVRKNLFESLPEYMVPSTIVVVDRFHFTPSGKLDRNGFPPPSTQRPDIDIDYVAPRTDQEKQLAAIWCEVLQLDRVGVQDNYIHLGGNSIRAVMVVAQAADKMDLTITPGELFDNPTIDSLLKLNDSKKDFVDRLKSKSQERSQGSGAYAIVGMAARMPGASDLEQYWSNLVEGRESVRFFTADELDESLDPRDTSLPSYVPARGIIDDAECFDARFFGMPPRAAALTDPQQRIMLELSWSALEDAGIIPSKRNQTIGVWAGSYSSTYLTKNILTNPELVRQTGEFNVGVHNEKDYIATRVAYALDLKGPAVNVNTACSTSLVALIEACQSLDSGHCDVAIAGGVSVTFPQRSGHVHQAGSIFSPDGHCRPFDKDAGGTMFSDGAGVVVIKRVEDAIADNDRIYAVVKGCGINNDGGSKASFTAPSIQGQSSAIAMAQAMNSIDPETISYIEAHGTATPLGDPIEITALQTVFEAQTDKKQFCAIGSVKSNIGHTVAAAGVAGLIKVAMSLHDERIPATLHYDEPNPQIDFENSPFFVCDELRPWRRNDQPRRAGVSSFGAGGTNAHVILEEAPLAVQNEVDDHHLPLCILPVSGKTEQALQENSSRLSSFLSKVTSDFDLNQIASTLQFGRDEFAHRASVVAESISDAADAISTKTAPRYLSRKADASPRDVVFMFPGQGAQYVRMGQNLYRHSSVFRDSLDHCAEILTPLLGRDLRDVLFPESGDEDAACEILQKTQFTQPALFAIGYSLAQVWTGWGIQPNALMGHSIGEFAAACVAGVFQLEDGLKMIAERGRAMQALPSGSMMSVRLPGAEVESLLWGDMAISAYNGPSLCVVSGPDEQVKELRKVLESREVVCRGLRTSRAFHSPMMESIVEPFTKFVEQFELQTPNIPIMSTVTGDWMSDDQAIDPKYWSNHLRAPVQFSDAVSKLWDGEDGDPSRILIELGPRKTLSTLAKRHAGDVKEQVALASLSDHADDNAEWHAMTNAVAQLWLCGCDIDWSLISTDGKPRTRSRHMSLPTYAFQRERHFIEPNSETVPRRERDVTNISNPSNHTEPSTIPDPTPMSRIPNLIAVINRVFEETSGLEVSDFDGDTTFFEMGLDSLVLTQAASALNNETGVEVLFRQLLENTPTVNSLAAWFDDNLAEDQYRPVAAQPSLTCVSVSNSAAEQPAMIAPQPSVLPTSTIAVSTPPTLGGGFENIVQLQLQAQMQLMQQQMQMFAAQSPSPTPAALDNEPVQPDTPLPLANPTEIRNDAEQNSTTETPSAKRFKTVKLSETELTDKQQTALDEIIRVNGTMMPKSKSYAQQHRKYMADPRTVSGFRPNMKEMTHPIVVERSKGALLWDVDGNEYIDFTCGFGSNFLGHTHDITVKAITEQVQKDYSIGPQSPLAGQVAKLFCELTGHDRMAFSNTGSEAVLGCTRLARHYTGRDLIVMFNGDYHGILDEVIARGSKKQQSFPAATGIPKDHVGNTLILDYGTDETLEIIRQNMHRLAAVLVEPVQSRMPEFQPREFLQELGRMTEKEPTALIFDEVITGLRIGLGGAQEHFGVKADLASYGKVFGGGMPIGLIGGRAEYMNGLDGGTWAYGDDSRPEAGMTYFAGTFVRHPLALAASKAIMQHVKDAGQPMYDRVNQLADYLAAEMNRVFEELEAPLFHAHFGTLFKIQFQQELPYSEVFFAGLRRRGMHIWDHRPCLLTLAHEAEHIDEFVKVMRDTIIECQQNGFMPGSGFQKSASQAKTAGPPRKGARIGKDENGTPAWFVQDVVNPGQYIQVGSAV